MRAVTLGEIVRFTNGGTPSRRNAEYWDGPIPWITGADITEAGEVSARSFISEAAVRGSSTNVVPQGTVLLLTRTSVGKVGVLAQPMAINQDITAITPSADIDTRYLVNFLRASKAALLKNLRGATIKGVAREDLARLALALPPLPEQRRIAAILDHAGALRAKRRQVLTHLDALIRATFQSMFHLGSLPLEPLGSHITEQQIGLDRRGSEQGPERAHDYVKMDAITRDGKLDLTSVTRVDATASEVARYSLRDGDLLFNTRNSRELVGKTAVYRGQPRLFNNNIMRIRLTEKLRPEYVHQYLWTSDGKRQLGSRKSGTTSVFAIYAKSLATLLVPIPPLGIQSEFAELVARIDRQRAVIQRSAATHEELFATLQSRAFRGEL